MTSIAPNNSDLQQFLNSEGYQVAVQSATDINPEHLLVNLGKIENDLPLSLHLVWTTLTPEQGAPLKDDSFFALQYFILLPFAVPETALADLALLVLHINARFELAYFGVVEEELVVYYRYFQVCSENGVDKNAISSVLYGLRILLDMFLPSLIPVGTGKKTLKQVRQEAYQTFRDQELSNM